MSPAGTGSSHLAGNVTSPVHFASPIQQCISHSDQQWILDSGAIDHITPFFYLLENAKPVTSVIQLPNGSSAPITHTGDITLTPH